MGQHLRRRSLFHDPAMLHHGDVVADLRRDPKIVGDEQQRDAEPLLDFVEQFEHLRLHRDVERGNRFVRDQNVGVERQRARDRDALALAAGKLVRIARDRVGRQVDQFEQLARLGQRFLARHAVIDRPFRDGLADRSLNPRITVGETIAEGPINYGMPRAEALAKARDLLELVDLPPDAISRYPHQFSGGQRQRIAIARALALDPDVLVADEAVSALDVSVQAQVLELLDEIQQRLGIALLFITHDLRVAAQICDDVAVMQHGRIVEQGPAAQVLTHPQQAYTRALLDAAPGRGWDFANFRPVVAAAE